MSNFTQRDTLLMFDKLLRNHPRQFAENVRDTIRDLSLGKYVSTQKKEAYAYAAVYLNALIEYYYSKGDVARHIEVCTELEDARSDLAQAASESDLKKIALTVEYALIEERLSTLNYGFFWSTRRSHYRPGKNQIVYYLSKNRRASQAKLPKSAYAHIAIHETAHAIIRCQDNPLIDVREYKDANYAWLSADDKDQAPSHCREFKRCLLYLLSEFGLIPDRSTITVGNIAQWGRESNVTVFQELEEMIDTYKPKEPYTYELKILEPLTFEGSWKRPKFEIEYLEHLPQFDGGLRTEEERLRFTKKSIALALAKSLGAPRLEHVDFDDFDYYATTIEFDLDHPLSQVYTAKILWEMSKEDLDRAPDTARLTDLQARLLDLCPDGISEESHSTLIRNAIFTEDDQSAIFDVYMFHVRDVWDFKRESDMHDEYVDGKVGDIPKSSLNARKSVIDDIDDDDFSDDEDNSRILRGISGRDLFRTYFRVYTYTVINDRWLTPMSVTAVKYRHMRHVCDAYLEEFGLKITTSSRWTYVLKDLLDDRLLDGRCSYLPIVDLPSILYIEHSYDLKHGGWHDKLPLEGRLFYDGYSFNGQVIPLEHADERFLDLEASEYRPQDFSGFPNDLHLDLIWEHASRQEVFNRERNYIRGSGDIGRKLPILGTELVIGDILGDALFDLKLNDEHPRAPQFKSIMRGLGDEVLALYLEGLPYGNLLPLIYENALLSSDQDNLMVEGWILDKETLFSVMASESANLDISLHLTADGDIPDADLAIEDVAFISNGETVPVYFRRDSIDISRYLAFHKWYAGPLREYVRAGIPILTLCQGIKGLTCVFSDGYNVYLMSPEDIPFIEGSSIRMWPIYDAITSGSLKAVASIEEVRPNFDLETSPAIVDGVEDYLDCKVFTYGAQMYVNLLNVPKLYGDNTASEIIRGIRAQSRIKLRNLIYRGPDQLFAIVKPSGDLGFVYSNSVGEFIELTYSEAWFRIYLSSGK